MSSTFHLHENSFSKPENNSAAATAPKLDEKVHKCTYIHPPPKHIPQNSNRETYRTKVSAVKLVIIMYRYRECNHKYIEMKSQ